MPVLFSGTFTLLLEFSDEYPNKPPHVRFLTKMFHPNSVLRNARARWPSCTL